MADPARVRAILVQPEGQPGRVFTDRFTVGRAGCGADLELDDEYVSNWHAAFSPPGAAGRWYVEDLGSMNGVRIIGRPPSRIYDRQYLFKGDRVKIGHTIITVVPA